ncbi:hypothetical protein MBLNU13_g06996t1 [Cladosporium sp. NU13]
MPHIQSRASAETGGLLHLLFLPYDVRWIIYSHLFPSLRQVYLMASKEGINPMMRPGSLSTDILLTCHQLHAEASDYLFNNYLFNIIGYKKHCMAHYKPLYKLMERYAKHGANVKILDNGTLSSTACVSIHAKEGHVEAMLQVRKRGVPRDLQEVEKEAAQLPEVSDEPAVYLYGPFVARLINCISSVVNGITRPLVLATVLVTGVAVVFAMAYSDSN